MGYLQDIVEIEYRAKTLNLSVSALCRKADVKYAAWWRWKSAQGNPTLRSFSAAVQKMRAALEAEEATMRARLNGDAA